MICISLRKDNKIIIIHNETKDRIEIVLRPIDANKQRSAIGIIDNEKHFSISREENDP